MENIVQAFILAGGKGDRLAPLTDQRAKPAVPFSKYRIIDFVMGSMRYGGVKKISILPQYEPRSLDRHIQNGYIKTSDREEDIRMIYPREKRVAKGQTRKEWYLGTAAAIEENLEEITDANQVAVFAADHIYTIDFASMLAQHTREPRDLTIAVQIRQVVEADFEIGREGKQYKYGIMEFDPATNRVKRFLEKPKPSEMPKLGELVAVSMGNYIFERDALDIALRAKYGPDFGKDVIPKMIENASEVFIWPHQGYWKDVGSLPDYFAACMELNIPKSPLDLIGLAQKGKPIVTLGSSLPPTRISSQGKISTISEGCEILGKVENCVIGPGVRIGHGSYVQDSVIFEGCTIADGVPIRRAILDKNNHVPSGITIGYDQAADRLKQFHIDPSGLVVVPKELLKRSSD